MSSGQYQQSIYSTRRTRRSPTPSSILEIKQQPLPEGMPAVSLTQDQLRAILGGDAVSAQGDTKVLAELITYLDLEQTGFSMHLR